MKRLSVVLILFTVILWACSKDNENNPSDSIKIISLTASLNPVKAWDTTVITVEATGETLQYGWEANHGSIIGGGESIRYSAGQCCVGFNTITCRVFNYTGEVSDTIMIRVTSYYDPENK
jgi:hypothetical protein